MRKILTEAFFSRPAPDVARDLIGMYIVRKIHDTESAYMITETEAYEGVDDRASHAFKGRTTRTDVMFGPAGVLYIYFIYGMYYMLNVVTGNEGHPSAVLIRAVRGISGPGRLTRALTITRDLNRLTALPENGLWFEDRGEHREEENIVATARVGVAYAGPIWSEKPWRFILK